MSDKVTKLPHLKELQDALDGLDPSVADDALREAFAQIARLRRIAYEEHIKQNFTPDQALRIVIKSIE